MYVTFSNSLGYPKTLYTKKQKRNSFLLFSVLNSPARSNCGFLFYHVIQLRHLVGGWLGDVAEREQNSQIIILYLTNFFKR